MQAAAIAGNNTLTLPTTTGNLLADNGSGALTIQTVNSGTSNALTLQSNNTTALTIDTSQNVGIGVTPNAWSGATALQMTGPSLWGSSGVGHLTVNTYFDGTNYKYISTGAVTDYYQLSGTHVWRYAASGTAGTNVSLSEAMRIDSSGNVGIGTATPGTYGKLVSVTGDNATTFAAVGATNMLRVQGYNSTYVGTVLEAVNLAQSANTPMFINASQTLFGISGTEKMRIDSSGNLLVGATSGTQHILQKNISGGYSTIFYASASSNPFGIQISYPNTTPNGGSNQFLLMVDSTANRAYFNSNGGLANYQANNSNLSDERKKTDIQIAGSYLDKICAIPVKTFLYKDQTDNDRTLGVIAQDVEKVAPELVDQNGWLDVAPEGEEPYKSIYQTDLQYALMKCIQELSAEVEALKAKVGA